MDRILLQLNIIGDGVFGNFLREIFAPHVEFSEIAENVVLAVPIGAYDEVAKEYVDKHLINVCSVQHEPNQICLQYSDKVTGIHPLFGPQSPKTNWTAVLTQRCDESQAIVDLFEKLGTDICEQLPDGSMIDGELHDRMMAVTHLAGMQQLENLRKIVERSAWVPENLVPASFRRIQNFVEQCGDFSPGTMSSIESNPFAKE